MIQSVHCVHRPIEHLFHPLCPNSLLYRIGTVLQRVLSDLISFFRAQPPRVDLPLPARSVSIFPTERMEAATSLAEKAAASVVLDSASPVEESKITMSPNVPICAEHAVFFAIEPPLSPVLAGLKPIVQTDHMYGAEHEASREFIKKACEGKSEVVLILPITASESFFYFRDDSYNRNLVPLVEFITNDLGKSLRLIFEINSKDRHQHSFWGEGLETGCSGSDLGRKQPHFKPLYEAGSVTSTLQSNFMETLQNWSVIN